MTDIDITPEIVDAVADWVFETGIDASVVHVLREAAAVMRHEQAEECARGQVPPRQWGNLRDVPDDVTWVQDKDGDEVVRDATRPHGWRWRGYGRGLDSAEKSLTDYAPYTEIVEHTSRAEAQQ